MAFRERREGAVHASRTAGQGDAWARSSSRSWRRDLAREAVVATGAALFLSAVGAFNTGEAPLAPRTAYWLVVIWAGAGLGFVAGAAIERAPGFERRPRLGAVVLTLGLTAPMTVFVWLATGWVFHLPLTAGFLLWLAGPVLLVCAAMVALNILADRQPRQTHQAPPSAGPAPSSELAPKLAERLPFALKGGAIHAVEAQDHYLRVHTSRGADLILMRLSDAIAELDGVEGAQTHRSWWVARDAVEAARTADGRAILALKGGVEAPVSRTYVKALRQAGWW